MKLKKYSKYKKSGIDWIGEIPEEWEIMKIKHFAKTVAGGTPSTANESFWEGDIPWLPSGMVHDNTIEEDKVFKFISFEALNNSSTKWIKPNSVLIALTGATCGNIGYLPFKATANQSVIGIETNKVDSMYLFYYLLTQKEQILINQTGGAQGGINQENVRDIFCSIPLLETQQNISSFLDSKTAQIEKLIEKDRNLIELLKEKRISLINQAVTKGIEKNVKMKDSGVKWIGEIPEDWEVNKIKHLLEINITDGPHETPEFLEEGIPFISAEAIKNSKIDFDYKRGYISLKDHKRYSLKSKPQLNDVFMIKSGATTGNIAMVETENEFNIWSPLALMRVNDKIKSKLFFYNLMSFYFKEQVKLGWSFGTQENIGMGVIQNLDIITPKNIEEQQEIVEFLDKETVKIDNHIKKVEKRIELLQEYKKSLIYNVITGKVEV